MKNILVFLMPYAGHFVTNVALIRYLASKGINLMIYGDSRFACLLPAGNIAWRDYPEKIAEYCQNGHTFQHDRNRAAYDYFSYMTDSRKILLKEQIDSDMEEILLRAISREISEFCPDIILYDAHACFTAAVRKSMPCPQIEINSSVYAPDIWRSESFKGFYREILRPSYPGDTSYEQIVSISRKREKNAKSNNLSFAYISPALQDEPDKISKTHEFIGFYTDIPKSEKREGIYVSRGTVSESYGAFLLYDTLVALRAFPEHITVSCGGSSCISAVLKENGFADNNMDILSYTDQKKILSVSKIFITHGGITGVREAIYAHTPMVMIPANFPDYQTALAVEKNHGGIMARRRPVSKDELQECCHHILNNYDEYTEGLKKMERDLKETWLMHGPAAVERKCEGLCGD